MKRVDYTNRKFGRLTVLSREDVLVGLNKRKTVFLKCLCDCGSEKLYRYDNLINRMAGSCGCLQKELVSKRSKKPKGHAATRAVWNYYLRNAESRNINWNLSFEEFKEIISKPCHYCGIKHGNTTKMKYGEMLDHNGVDRFDNTKGYSINNCVPACKRCNIAKSDLNPKEFEEWIMNVYSNLFEGVQ